ncbi:MAG: hypothetical protein HYX67_04815 [Candidatus Melainabacteria bacterium]|nr:hypothetical protein [Candidatus Melainabacteria bacterium]
MSTKSNILMMLSMVIGMASLLPASADECISKTTTYITPAQTLQIMPQSVILPSAAYVPTQTVKTTKTTVTTTEPTVIQPTIISSPDTISRTMIITGSAPSSSATTSVTASISNPFPIYGNRLAAMNEQIDRSLANGWVTAYQANNLRADSARLGQMIINRSSSQADVDVIEKGLTGLNISIQEAMRASGHTAAIVSPTF